MKTLAIFHVCVDVVIIANATVATATVLIIIYCQNTLDCRTHLTRIAICSSFCVEELAFFILFNFRKHFKLKEELHVNLFGAYLPVSDKTEHK